MPTRYEHWDTANASTAGGYTYIGQTFTPQISHTIRMVKLAASAYGATHVVVIMGCDENDKPVLPVLATGLMSAAWFSPFTYISLGAGVSLTAGVRYAIRVVTNWPTSGENVAAIVKTRAPLYPDGCFFFGRANETYVMFDGEGGRSDYDWKFEEWDGTLPTPPVQISPENDTTVISLTPTLVATYHHCAAIAQNAAQWQIDVAGGDFSSPVWSSGIDGSNLLSIVVPGGNLSAETEYDWRVRHRDSDNEWSDWSWTWSFTTSTAPTVTTQAITDIEPTVAIGNGNITDLGDPDPTAYGVCWNTVGSPTIADSKTDEGAISETGAFATLMTGLVANTLYYIKAYATNTIGTVYGAEVSFTTEPLVAAGNRAYIIG